MSKFYRKENKFLKLENSKEALYKAQGMSTGKKNDLGEATENTKGKEKRKEMRSELKAPTFSTQFNVSSLISSIITLLKI